MAWVVFAFIAGVLVWVAIAFNRLVRLRNQVRTAWADIDVQLHRRHDLVPSLVAAVRAYAG
ncbi:MAG TPA: LemA family protein, partial [Chiayiivirga sp.]|nr:LemA family protein [Chiayiivirga sp.]